MTLPSPNTSRSPVSFSIGWVAAKAGFTGCVMAHSYSVLWIKIVEEGKSARLPTWSPCVCDTATYAMSAGFTPISVSCAASVLARRWVMAPFATTMPSGMAATASGMPVSQSSSPLA